VIVLFFRRIWAGDVAHALGSIPAERERKRERQRERDRERVQERELEDNHLFFFFPKLVLQLATRKKPKHLLKGGNFTNTCL
jgi:hypothetical protein